MRSLSTLAIEIEPAEASPSAKKQPEAELAVFWEGTGHALAPITTQVGLFYELMEAQDVTHKKWPSTSDGDPHFKMGFDGCGVSHGVRGLLWGVGLQTQASRVVLRCRELLECFEAVNITVLGVSRGGVAGLVSEGAEKHSE